MTSTHDAKLEPVPPTLTYVSRYPDQERSILRRLAVTGQAAFDADINPHGFITTVYLGIGDDPVEALDSTFRLDTLRDALREATLVVHHGSFPLGLLKLHAGMVPAHVIDTCAAAKLIDGGRTPAATFSLEECARRQLGIALPRFPDKVPSWRTDERAVAHARHEGFAARVRAIESLWRRLEEPLFAAGGAHAAALEFDCVLAVARMIARGIGLDGRKLWRLLESEEARCNALSQALREGLGISDLDEQRVLDALKRKGVTLGSADDASLADHSHEPLVRDLLELRRHEGVVHRGRQLELGAMKWRDERVREPLDVGGSETCLLALLDTPAVRDCVVPTAGHVFVVARFVDPNGTGLAHATEALAIKKAMVVLDREPLPFWAHLVLALHGELAWEVPTTSATEACETIRRRVREALNAMAPSASVDVETSVRATWSEATAGELKSFNSVATRLDKVTTSRLAKMPLPVTRGVGGRRTLLDCILPLVPPVVGRFYEPFAGSAAVTFALLDQVSRRERKIDEFILSDIDYDLMNTYKAVRDDVEAVIAALAQYKYDAALYKTTRDLDPGALPAAARAARFIFLTKVCVDKPLTRRTAMAKLAAPVILDAATLRGAHVALQGVRFLCGSFDAVDVEGANGDFVFCDPPCLKSSSTGKLDFVIDDLQIRLASWLRRLKKRRVGVLVSNGHTRRVMEIYRDGFELIEVGAARSERAAATAAQEAVEELLIR